MTTDSVKAILDGRKTQTRRVVKPELKKLIPHGQVGDRLWVREKIEVIGWFSGLQKARVEYATGESLDANCTEEQYIKAIQYSAWTPSIFMPRWASRLTLEITEVRAERLQEISDADILAEGITSSVESDAELRLRFRNLWDSLNAKRGYGWDKNPWVWVLEFDNIGVRVK